MGRYAPGSADHAVEQAVVGVRLAEPADDARFQSAIERAAELAVEYTLPGRVALDPFSMVFGRQIITQGYRLNSELHPGTLFQRVNPDGSMAEELTIERGAVTYRTRSYRRWADVEIYIEKILCPVASILAGGEITALSVIELRCVDKFTCEGPDYPALDDLIRPDTQLIPAIMLASSEMQHCHIGWFDGVTDAGRYLINVNLDINEAQGDARIATILQVISRHASGNGGLFEPNIAFADAVLKEFKDLHRRDKALLAGLITDDLQNQISLVGSSGIEKFSS